MPARPRPVETPEEAIADIYGRLRNIDDAMRDRLLPPGYFFNIVDGDLVITRKADGATSITVFA